jgi:hypothetical protein
LTSLPTPFVCAQRLSKHTVLATVIKEANKLYYYELINKSENKIQTPWKIIKKKTSTMQKMDHISQIRIQDKHINNPKEIADGFNKYFITAAGKI